LKDEFLSGDEANKINYLQENLTSREAARIEVEVWEAENVLLEKYSYAPGRVEPLPDHLLYAE
jgi:hypothetical protein